MSKLGEHLKAEREKRGLTIHEIGLSLKISPKILKAIEDGEQKDLPAKTFLRGFVKSYAQYLKIDTKEVLDLFQSEFGNTRPESPKQLQNSTIEKNNNVHIEKIAKKNEDLALANQGSQKHLSLIVAGVLLILIAFVAKMMDKYQKESNTSSQTALVERLSTTTTTVPLAAVAISTETSQAISTAEKHSTQTAISQSVPLVTASSTSTTMPIVTSTTSTTITTLKPITTSTLPPTPSTTVTTMAPTTTTTSSSTTTTIAKAIITEVIVEALNQVKIKFSLNNGLKWETLELSADQVHTFRSRGNVDLEISDGGAINIIVNGRERGVPGTIGKPIKLVYPK